MPKLRRPAAFAALALGLVLLAPPSWAQTRPPLAERIAKAQGLDRYDQVDAIRYTFNITLPGVTISRSWDWQIKTGQVTYAGKDKDGKPVRVTYSRAQLDSAPANVRDEIEPAFVNDEYNLFFPLHVYWDESAEVSDAGVQKLPLGKGSARQVVVKYPSDGGYTPGDTWDLWVRSDYRVEAFAYHRGGANPPHLVIATWAGYKKAGPFLLSTDRHGTADGKPIRIFFTNVSVKLAGSDKWMAAR